MRSYSAVVAEQFLFVCLFFFRKVHLCVVLIFWFFRFSPFLFRALLLLFFLPDRRLPSQSGTCFRYGRKGHWSTDCRRFGADTSLGLALERKPKALLSVPPGASKPSQNNDVDIIGNEETPGLFEDFIKVDSSVHDFEIESGNSVPSTKCNVKGRSSGRCHY